MLISDLLRECDNNILKAIISVSWFSKLFALRLISFGALSSLFGLLKVLESYFKFNETFQRAIPIFISALFTPNEFSKKIHLTSSNRQRPFSFSSFDDRGKPSMKNDHDSHDSLCLFRAPSISLLRTETAHVFGKEKKCFE